MNLLILCDLFPPAFGPRMGYLCKYLSQYGWEPTVITEHIPDQTFAFLQGETPVHYVRFYRHEKGLLQKLEWLWVFMLNTLFNYKNRKMYREANRQAQVKKFDAILCSTYRTFPLPAACKLAQKKNIPLVADLRDIIEQYSGNEFISRPLPKLGGLENGIANIFKKQSLRKRNRVLRRADHITTVSPWHVEVLRAFNPHVSLIYNGFDPEVFFPAPVPTNCFYITYTGRLLSLGMRNPELLFEAMKQLSDEGFITPDQFQVRWYMDEGSKALIEQESHKYNLSAYMQFHNYVPATAIPALLNESAIILLLTNKSDQSGPKGIMTTKFFEALAVEKPILCVRGDEGCLEETIRLTRSGLSAHHCEEVYHFIQEIFGQWKTHLITRADVNSIEIEKFSRKNQAAQFAAVFRETIQPK